MNEPAGTEGSGAKVDCASPPGEVSGARRVNLPYRPGLDVVRFLAALWVMLNHAGAASGGGHAVAVFFVLSGYLIGGQLVSEKVFSGRVRFSEFYFKRVTRIWVPYFIVVAGYILLFIARGQDSVPGFYDRTFGALTYTYNLVNDLRGNIHPTWVSANQIWSLSIEEQFYLVAPLMIGLLPARWIAPVSLLLTAFLLWVVPLYAGLFLGVLMAAALVRRQPGSLSALPPLLVGAVLLLVLGLVFAVGQTSISQASWITYGLSAVAVLLAAYLELPRRWYGTLRYLGLMTYSYYLIHGVPVYFLGPLYRRLFAVSDFPVWIHVVFGLLALPLSFLFVRYVELPTLGIRGKVLKSGSRVIRYAPWLAWGLNLVGVIRLVYAR